MFATTVLAGAAESIPFGVARLLAGLVFSLGLVLVVVGGAELFTGNTLMAMAWAIVYAGNFIGALGTALLVLLSGQCLSGDGAVTKVAMKLAVDKARTLYSGALSWRLVQRPRLSCGLDLTGRADHDRLGLGSVVPDLRLRRSRL